MSYSATRGPDGCRGNAGFVSLDVDIGVQLVDVVGGALDLRPTDIGVAVDDLSLQVRALDDIVIDDSQPTDAGRCEILDSRRAKSAGTDNQDAPLEQPLLALGTDFVHDNVSRVAIELGRVEAQVAHTVPFGREREKDAGRMLPDGLLSVSFRATAIALRFCRDIGTVDRHPPALAGGSSVVWGG